MVECEGMGGGLPNKALIPSLSLYDSCNYIDTCIRRKYRKPDSPHPHLFPPPFSEEIKSWEEGRMCTQYWLVLLV